MGGPAGDGWPGGPARTGKADGCTVAEAAQALGISVTNAKVLQHRAMRRAAQVAAGLE